MPQPEEEEEEEEEEESLAGPSMYKPATQEKEAFVLDTKTHEPRKVNLVPHPTPATEPSGLQDGPPLPCTYSTHLPIPMVNFLSGLQMAAIQRGTRCVLLFVFNFVTL